MLLSDRDKKRFNRRLLESRLRILCNYGFYGTLLMHVSFSLDNTCRNVASSYKKISFNPAFLKQISDRELDLVLMHEITHLALRHNSRRRNTENKKVFDLAADIVTNSNLFKSFGMDPELLFLQGNMLEHQDPFGKEGCDYSVEELYELLTIGTEHPGDDGNKEDDRPLSAEGNDDDAEGRPSPMRCAGHRYEGGFDDHSRWLDETDPYEEREWQKHVEDACEMISIRDPSNERGLLPMFAARMFKELRKSRIDWRIILHNCLEEEISDYSFLPPDRRFLNSDFFLPGMNDLEEAVKGILFFIDTSGSMSDAQITTAFSEIKGAIEQFQGRLKGFLGFFDCSITEPVPFDSVDSLMKIKPFGGGGTDYSIIFAYVRDHMKDAEIATIIIMTDGYAPWPHESESGNIPVIWMINNDRNDPPWGKVIRLPEDSVKHKYS